METMEETLLRLLNNELLVVPPEDKGLRFTSLGMNKLSRYTFRTLLLLNSIDKYFDTPEETIRWFLLQLKGITHLDINGKIDLKVDIIKSMYDYITDSNNIDEDTGYFWLFENGLIQKGFLRACSKIEKYSDILLICNNFGFDICHTAELFAAVIFGISELGIADLEDFSDSGSYYYRPMVSGIMYYFLIKHNLIPFNVLLIKNENKDNYDD